VLLPAVTARSKSSVAVFVQVDRYEAGRVRPAAGASAVQHADAVVVVEQNRLWPIGPAPKPALCRRPGRAPVAVEVGRDDDHEYNETADFDDVGKLPESLPKRGDLLTN
jgi:hypothetical protein